MKMLEWSVIVEATDSLHKAIVAVEKVHISLSGSNGLLVKSPLGFLRCVFAFEDDEARAGASAILLFDSNVTFFDSVSFKELNNLINSDPPGKATHDKSLILVIVADLFGKRDVFLSAPTSSS